MLISEVVELQYFSKTISIVTIMDGTQTVDSPTQVQQLQDLVKKLEHQNEILRKNQSNLKEKSNVLITSSDRTPIDVTYRVPSTKSANRSSVSSFASAGLEDSVVSLDDVDVLDLDRLSLKDDEDSWLYESPNKFASTLPHNANVNPYEFVRQDLDTPGCNLEIAKTSLKTKLDSVSKHGSSSPYSSKHKHTLLSPTTTAMATPTSNSIHNAVSSPNMRKKIPANSGIKPPILSLSGSKINSNMYTRPKRATNEPVTVASRPAPQAGQQAKCPSDDQKENVAEPASVSDIQVLAKLQEESLRQSFSAKESPFTAPRRSLGGLPISGKTRRNSPFGSSRSSPARDTPCEGEGIPIPNHHRHTDHQTSSGSQDSINSGPDAQYGSQELGTPNSPLSGGIPSNTRRSLPNLTRGGLTPPKRTSSDPYMDDDCDRVDTEKVSQTARLKSPSHPAMNRPLSPSMSRLKRPSTAHTRNLSPHRTGLPTPVKTGIPRPSSSRSALPTPVKSRSNIPSPMSVRPSPPVMNHTEPEPVGDDSWMDGCF